MKGIRVHKGSFLEMCPWCDWRGDGNCCGAKSSPGSSRKPAFTGRPVGARVCNYCHGERHWKDQCPLLNSKVQYHLPLHAPAMLCSTVSDKICVDADVGSGFEPFIADAAVSLVGSDKRVP